MFELLLLSCIALIIFSQFLPEENQENKSSRPQRGPGPSTKATQLMTPVQPKYSKKKPCRRVFDRAA